MFFSEVMPVTWRDRITTDPQVMGGKPVLRGTRIPVDLVLELIASGWSEVNITANYPGVTHDDIEACRRAEIEAIAERAHDQHSGASKKGRG